MNVYRNIDKSKVQFDFLIHNAKNSSYIDEIKKWAGKFLFDNMPFTIVKNGYDIDSACNFLEKYYLSLYEK